MKSFAASLAFTAAGISTVYAAPISREACQVKLSAIANGRLSADDTLILSDCAVAGIISSSDIEKAYEQAKSNRN